MYQALFPPPHKSLGTRLARHQLGLAIVPLLSTQRYLMQQYPHLWCLNLPCKCFSLQPFGLVSSPDPAVSQGETIWWTESNFLGLCTSRQCNPLKKGTHTRVDYTVVREVLHNITLILQSHWSLPLLGISPRSLTLPDCFSPGCAHGLDTRLHLEGQC